MPALTARIVETIAPARLGRSFRWLFASAIASNVGDGIALAAGPLLIASQTSDAFLVSMGYFAQILPPLLFSVVAGTVADRLDRRRIAIWLNVVRAVVLAVVASTIAGGSVSIAVVLGALLVMSTAETFADIAEGSLLPRLVPREHLGVANARSQAAFLSLNQLIAPPIGAFLFVLGAAVPFGVDAACYVLAALLISRIARSVASPAAGAEAAAKEHHFLRDTAEGIRWLIAHPAMRTLAITIVAFNVTYGAAWSVLVLYAREQLGMDALGYGLITTATAIGGLIGTTSYGRLERRFALGDIMRVGLLIETATHLVLALTHSPAVALAVMVVFGAHAFVWGTTATTIRQRAVPDELLGRVSGVYRLGVFGGLVIGAPIGGVLAQEVGITAPFWFGFIGSAILVTLLWGQFPSIAHEGGASPLTGSAG